ncbi:cytoplasmic NADPH oxidoreductase-associated [FeFe]-hydrogenase [Syntrophotalea carbinolica DSM 2380]|uniref:Cytoplasmic NADPH oxidoreductase-associated [FeFe]-hydrogenase n=1 Tax=Syntrophotalea carbinolica (strain DSM 2380 / NBRC 103641 / GraBd1) TaxID=338963 RepID=Q3A1L6_SYNC1|nr:2Fe-2S iron-sulfur cluster binding domain-containing protein [Syntrophotalea carbinolica]ABA89741.1 cytoplasmic NADPH oxidoreductase-associated [FeFe]-hydrogenase [Syntrophotalea carbinolica DSM 2380]
MQGTINGKLVEFGADETILQTARRYDMFIPTLCELENLDHTPGTCRVCLVEIKRKGDDFTQIVTSCNTPMEEGIEVQTRSRKVREQQRLQVNLLLTDHEEDCATCVRHGDCELQDVAQFVGLKEARFKYDFSGGRTKDISSPSVIRDMTKCIRCGRCVTICREVQGTDVLFYANKGVDSEIGVRDSDLLNTSDCVSCGQCTLVCPVGALAERDDTEEVIDYLNDPEMFTVVQFAPATRVALGEEFNMKPGSNVEGQMITAFRKMGADVVLDTNFTADVVIMEEGSELLHRVKEGGTLPLLTSCSPGWINYVEKFYPDMICNLSTTKSPQQCLGAIAKTYLAEKMAIDPAKMRVISIMPCTAKKEEAKRPEFTIGDRPEVDVVLTTRELGSLLKREGIWLPDLEEGNFDNPWMGVATGAAEIFGSTGGVMEAAVRTVHYIVTGEEIPGVDLKAVRGLEGIREASVDLGELGTVNVAIANSLKSARELLERVRSGEKEYHFIEVMACPGGCMGGGGQPKHKRNYREFLTARQKAIYDIDAGSELRQSHRNPLVKEMYDSYFGEPYSSERSHKYLHTTYTDKKRVVKHTIKEIWDELSEGR